VTRRRTAEQVCEDRISHAAYPWREGPALHIDVPVLLVTREREEKEPDVDVSRAIGREPLDWEADAITAARLAERAAGRALLAGTVQP